MTAGDTVEVRVAVTNRSNRSVEVPAFPSCYFAVWQQQDEGTPRHVAGCDHALSIVTLATDETFTGTAPWRPGVESPANTSSWCDWCGTNRPGLTNG
ncbi:MAG: hypothetical protein GWN99_02310 [Gemmatimonadetes bacterium]|uniref:Uncharacterized protein n=1 Tax=Candidatus Kutchimonas denitrificans TaxID=3056748 RepID=A0AAE4Z887_9BACT|nr:hypothetical protein [Gemmatimonadota bacterium]NIR74788.1 hypothetical protein [Candidatus Kutchimonas denitrificans]NIR99899.1 hypothetical protein [Gemmatimonadota bacterium]NIT65483.1 hypothetical protein [Gemmatimonadota bacterium]NIU52453.1 hypothetical protein [Gemmatimonadota bacterium]